MKLQLGIKSWRVSLTLLGALSVSTSSMALDLPECKAGEYLWLVTAGNPAGTLMPKADMRVSTVTFQDWTDGSKTLRTAAFTNVPQGRLGAAKTFERYTGGGNLGWFAKSWPSAVEGYEIENFKALPPRNPAPSATGGEYPTDFASSNLTDGLPGETLAQVLSSPSFDGKLTYIAPSQARIDFVTIALCTRAAPTAPKPRVTDTAAAALPSGAQLTEAQIAARIAQLQDQQQDELKDIEARAAAARKAAEDEKRQSARLEEERLEAERLEAERLEAEQLAKDMADSKIQDKTETAAVITHPKIKTTPEPKPVPAVYEPQLQSDVVNTQTKRDMITSGGMAAAAVVHLLAHALGKMFGASRAAAPIPAPAPSPAPQPVTSLARGGGTGRKKEKNKAKERPRSEPKVLPPQTTLPEPSSFKPAAPESAMFTPTPHATSSAKANLKVAKRTVIIEGSQSFTSEIPNASPQISKAYAAVGRVGYPHAPKAARDAMNLGFGSAVLIQPNKVLTNYHVWDIIKDMSGVGIEFDALEGNEISEFITLESTTPEILEGLDAVVLTLSRRTPRPSIWPKDLDYNDPEILDRTIYAIGHPIKPKDANAAVRLAIIEEFGSPNPLWNVKRYSTGPIVKHKNDVDGDVLFDVPVADYINEASVAAALCHRASTVGGNSGGAVICAQSGDFLGLHFGGQRLEGHKLNYAVPGRSLLKGLAALGFTPEGTESSKEKPKTNEASNYAQAEPDAPPLNFNPPNDIAPETGAGVTGDLFADIPPEAPHKPQNVAVDKNIEQSLTEYIASRSPEGSRDTPAANEPDDLTRIEGIGPKTALALKEAGIGSFKALAQGSPYDLLPLLEAAGLPRRDPTTWPAQAALAANGDWDTLEAWQDQLHGGRETS